MSVLAIDIGTSRIKALLADWHGHLVEVRSTSTPRQSIEAGAATFPVDAVFAAIEGLVSGLAADHPGQPVDTLAFSCLGTAMAPLDVNDKPLGPALAPADARPQRSPWLVDQLAIDPARLRACTGSDPGVSSFLLHALWWIHEHPEVMDDVARFRSLRGYAMARLCDADVEDRSWVSRTMLAELETGTWSESILAAAGLPRDVLPEIMPSTATFAVRTDVTERLRLAPGAVAVLGGMDNGCSVFGAAGPDRSGLVDIVGTYEHMAGAVALESAHEIAAAAGAVVHAHVLPGRYVAMTRVPIGDLLGRVTAGHHEELDRLIDSMSAEPSGLAMSPSTEAIDAAVQAGMPRREILQGVIESAAGALGRFAEAWTALGLPAEPVAVVGGAAAHEVVLRLKAAVLGRSMVTLHSNEGAGLGALRLAAMAVRGATPDEACRLFQNPITRTIRPPMSTWATAAERDSA